MLSRYSSQWYRLERVYENRTGRSVRNIGLSNLRIGNSWDPEGFFSSFRNITFVGADIHGLYIEMIFPFNILYKPLIVPWEDCGLDGKFYDPRIGSEIVPVQLPQLTLIFPNRIYQTILDLHNKTRVCKADRSMAWIVR